MASVHLAATCRPADLAAGARLGRYEIVSFLARGGMAEVYLARARGIGGFEKTVALKRLAPERGLSAEDTAMFLDEARLAARLEHPNIVQVFDAGEDDGVVFLAMEHVDGTDLRALLGRGRALPLGPALAIAIDTAAALQHAHELRAADGRPLQLVHRDVSPSNILLSRTGAVKLADFGIAKAAGHGSLSRAGADRGKACYMAPEQWLGAGVDRRADVFALAVVLFEMTTGMRPFDASGDLASGGALPPSALVPGYPAALERVLERALAREPAARHPSADALRAELEAVARSLGLDASARALATYLQSQAPAGDASAGDPMSPAFVTGTVGLAAPPRRRVRGRSAAALALVAGLALAAATWARSEAGAPARTEPTVDGAAGTSSRAASDSASAAASSGAASDSASAAASSGAASDSASAAASGGAASDSAGAAGRANAAAATADTTTASAAPAAPDSAPAATSGAAATSASAGELAAPTATRSERARPAPRRRPSARSRDRRSRPQRRRPRPAAPAENAGTGADIPDDLFPGTWRPQ